MHSVSVSLLSQSKSSFSKGGLWTVDADYRRSLLAALKRSPYHPYHSYFTPPVSPRYTHTHTHTHTVPGLSVGLGGKMAAQTCEVSSLSMET